MVQQFRQDGTNGGAQGVQEYSGSATSGSFAVEHAARKGYSKAITLAEAQYAKIWTRLFGWREIGKDHPPCLATRAIYHADQGIRGCVRSLTPDSDSKILLRVEGYWDQPTSLENSF